MDNSNPFSIVRFLPSRSLAGKVFVIFVVCIAAFVAVIGWISYRISGSIITEKAEQSSRQTIVQAGQRLDYIYASYDKFTFQFITDRVIMAGLRKINDPGVGEADEYLEQKALKKILIDTSVGDNSINGIYLVKTNGNLIATNVRDTLDATTVTETDWFQQAIKADGSLVWLDTRKQGLGVLEPTFALARAIKDGANVLAVLLVEVKESMLMGQLADIQLGDQSDAVVIDDDRRVISSRESDRIAEANPYEIPDGALKGRDGFLKFSDSRLGEALGVYYQSPVNRWTLLGVVPADSLLKDSRRILNATILVLAIALVVALMVGVGVFVMMRRPIRELLVLMEKGESGNLAVRSAIGRKDELGQLGRHFNQMMGKISLLIKQASDSVENVSAHSSQILNASLNTANASREIAASTDEISRGALSLSSEAERGRTLGQEIVGKFQSLTELHGVMRDSASQVNQVCEDGAVYMDELKEKTSVAGGLLHSMVAKVDGLQRSTQSMHTILEVMQSIIKKTNILAMNASIEAARAGPAGKGFRVIADEIRQMVVYTKRSLSDIDGIAAAIRQESDQTVALLAQAYPIFQTQIASFQETNRMFGKVDASMDEFRANLGTVGALVDELLESQRTMSQVVGNVSAFSEQSAAATEEVASLCDGQRAISEDMNQLALSLNGISEVLKKQIELFII